MKYIFLIYSLLFTIGFAPSVAYTQDVQSLERELVSAKNNERARILIQLGYFYVNSDPKKSLEFGKDALKNAISFDNKHGQAISFGLIGQSYLRLEEYDKASDNLEEESKLIEKKGKPWVVNQFNLGLVSKFDERERRAVKYYEESLKEAIEINNEEYILKNYEALFNVNFDRGKDELALKYFRLYVAEKDKKFLEENQKEINQMQNAYEDEIFEIEEEKEAIIDTLLMTKGELELMRLQDKVSELQLEKGRIKRTILIWLIFLLAIIAIVVLISYLQKRKSNQIITLEKLKSDELLHNILPAKVVADLKEKGSSIPEKFSEVSVFFSDFAGFTKLSSKIEPEKLIDELNDIFTEFDNIMEKYNCERIKTIGDAYLAVCGLPVKNPDHVKNILLASIDIVEWLEQRNLISEIKWRIRIGVHSGNLIGGIVGTKKYIYDVFGDTINTASRMETNSEPGRINVSKETYNLAKNNFRFTARPEMEVKGKGKMKMYFLSSVN